MEKRFMTGNEAIAEAAVQAGCRYFFGYPITPQSEIPKYMSKGLPEVGVCYLQAESEIAAIYMVFGAAGAGARVTTSSSSPGISMHASVPANDLAVEVGEKRATNMVMLGAYVARTGIVTKEDIANGLREFFGGKIELLDVNMRAFEKGMKYPERFNARYLLYRNI